jgi:cytochrome P450
MRARYDRIIDTLIDKHLADPEMDERIDILAMMLHTLRDSGEEINRGEVADELLTLLVAGHETTASSLAWAVDRLRRHPFLLERLEREAETDESTLRAATILEVLRTRPVIHGTGRVAMEPFKLGDHLLPPGTVMIAAAALIHQDERFHEHALAFDPDRYVGTKPDTYAWIPFGGGMRRCLGAAFAQMEMDVVLRTLLRHFELAPASDPPERERFRGVAFAPAKGGMARVRRRSVPLGPAAELAGAVAGARGS